MWVPRAAASQGLLASDLPITVGQAWSWGPAVAALLAAALTGGRAALRDLGARLVRWRVGWRWYVLVLVGPAAFSFAVAGTYAAVGGSWRAAAPRAFDEGLLGLVAFFLVLALTDGLGEEVGWRGYALPRLLAGNSALASSLFLGVVWALWHLPLVWTQNSMLYGEPVWLLLVELPAKAILFTWVFLHTRGSVLLAVMLHATSNLFALPQATETGELTLRLLAVAAEWLLALVVLAATGPRLARVTPPEALAEIRVPPSLSSR